jgi:dihydropteroate synthase
VAAAALDAGASIVNDVSAGRHDPDMFDAVRELEAGMVLMHMLGDPKTMQVEPHYEDVVADVQAFLNDGVEAAVMSGIARDHLCVDPGIGFGKTLEHNLTLLREIDAVRVSDRPLLVGPSRKSFIGRITGAEADDRIGGTAGAVAWLAAKGVEMVRVHDVREMRQVVQVVDAIRGRGSNG